MWPTVEVRWFHEGRVPPQVWAWFREGETPPEAQPPRVDRYLRLPGLDGLGIKLREGRVEIKQRRRQYGILRLPADASPGERPPWRDAQGREFGAPSSAAGQAIGQVEGWRKWSFELAAVPLAHLAVPAASWTAVRKARSVRRYRIDDGQGVVPLTAGDYAPQGCGVELTEVEVFGQAWWTLGLEAFGDEPSLQQDLLAIAGHVLAGSLPMTLGAEESYGYPRWLDLVSQRETP